MSCGYVVRAAGTVTRRSGSSDYLEIDPRGRRPGRGEPVQGHIVEEAVALNGLERRVDRVAPLEELLEDPREQPEGRVDQGVPDRLW